MLAMNGASVALGLSTLPFQGPLGSVRLAQVNGQFIPFPTQDDLEESDLDLIVSGSRDAVLMIEGFAREMPEARMLEAIAECHKYIRILCELQNELFEKVGVKKREYPQPVPDGTFELLKSKYYSAFKTAKQTPGKHARADAVATLEQRAVAELIPDPAAPNALNSVAFNRAWHELENHVVRD